MIDEGGHRERTLQRDPGPAYWLVENAHDPMEVLTVPLRGGRRALSVFSHREEAEMFLWLGGLADGWRVKKSGGRELAQEHLCPHASIGFVALDPLPEMVAERTADLVSLPRERFTERLTAEEAEAKPLEEATREQYRIVEPATELWCRSKVGIDRRAGAV